MAFRRFALPAILTLCVLFVLMTGGSDLHYSILSNLGLISAINGLSKTQEGPPPNTHCFSPLLVSEPSPETDLVDATTYLQHALIIDSAKPSASYGLGYVSILRHDYGAAWAALSVGKARREQITVALWVRSGIQTGELLQWDVEPRGALGITLNGQARQTLLAGCRDVAVVLYELATEVAPEQADLWLDRIDVYADQWTEALEALQLAKTHHPTNPYLDLIDAYLTYYARQDKDASVQALILAYDHLGNVDSATLSVARRKWLYKAYLLSADLAIQTGEISVGKAWLAKALNVASDEIPSHEALARLTQLQSARP